MGSPHSRAAPAPAEAVRAEGVRADAGAIARLRERGWLLQVNASSLLGAHGREQEEAGWRLMHAGHADLVASDGHRSSRPPFLDEAHRLARARVGEAADALFDGSALAGLGGIGEAQLADGA